MNSTRKDFAIKSLEKSKRITDDPLIKFVVLWIGLNALYDNSNNGIREADKINIFFQQNEGKIKEIIHKRENELQEMRKVIQEYPLQHDKIDQILQSRGAIWYSPIKR